MHQYMVMTVVKLNQNFFFKYISSIRLAVPVMIGVIITVACGTILESRFNSEYARIAIYDTDWFQCLIYLLALNVFCAMMSRYPWKKHQVGFVVTHIGILVLLFGGWITKHYGTDGSMQIEEGQAQNTVVLPELMVGYQFEGSPTLSSVYFYKTLFPKSDSQLSFINEQIGHVIQVKKFLPFANVEHGYRSTEDKNGPIALSFGLKSAFFDVKEWLHSENNPSLKLGPATLKLIVEDTSRVPQSVKTSPPSKKQIKSNSAKSESELLILDAASEKTLRSLALNGAKENLSIQIQGAKITVQKIYRSAVVSENKLSESEDPASPPNPAIELSIEKDGKKVREVLYAKFSGFSLNQEGVFGLKFRFHSNSTQEETNSLPPGHPHLPSTGAADEDTQGMPAGGPGNIIEFHISRENPTEAHVVLKKNAEVVMEKNMKEGESLVTPWMGIQIFIAHIGVGVENQTQVTEGSPEAGKELPTSAIFVQPAGGEEPFWLAQGEVKKIDANGRPTYVVFSQKTITLPFELRLDEFHKKDYPGTQTPYSYESLVTNTVENKQTLISMNEPLKYQDYTLYQASFSMNPGQKVTSILSVNKDPGRWIKYLGSLILSIGVILFTLMKSRVYKGNQSQRKNL